MCVVMSRMYLYMLLFLFILVISTFLSEAGATGIKRQTTGAAPVPPNSIRPVDLRMTTLPGCENSTVCPVPVP